MFIGKLKLLASGGDNRLLKCVTSLFMNGARCLINKVKKKKLKKGPTGCRCLLFCYPAAPQGSFLVAVLFSRGWGNGKE